MQCTVQQTCIYTLDSDGNVTVVGVYVDDLLVTVTSKNVVENFFDSMVSLEIKDLGVVNKFLDLRVMLDSEAGNVLDQEVTIDLLLQGQGLESANSVSKPNWRRMQRRRNARLRIAGCVIRRRSRKHQVLSVSLLWIARCTRPDICFVVHRANRQTHQSTMSNW